MEARQFHRASVSIPFKRVSVFKDGNPDKLYLLLLQEFPSPLSGSRFSKEVILGYVDVTRVPVGFHPL